MASSFLEHVDAYFKRVEAEKRAASQRTETARSSGSPAKCERCGEPSLKSFPRFCKKCKDAEKRVVSQYAKVARSSSSRAKCERCGEPSLQSSRFCKKCKSAVLKELEASGYLQKVPQHHFRSREAQENTWETKHGTGHG